MWKRLRRISQDSEEGSSQIMSDLALSMVGIMVITFTGYILKFRSEAVAQAPPTQQQPPKQQPQESDPPQLVSLNGPLTNVVFCLDLSGSMVGYDGPNKPVDRELAARFGVVKDRVKRMVRSLKFQNFCVIGFGGDPHDMTKPRLVKTSYGLAVATPDAREFACRQIDSWQAIGGTPTLPALKAAYAMQGVEHVVLLTDGLPTLEGRQDDVLRFVRQARGRGGRTGQSYRNPKIVIDVIGIGDQSNQGGKEASMALIDFTRRVADATGGFFQAW